MLEILDANVLLGLQVALLSIIVDTIFGWLISIKKGEFTVKKVPQFLARNVLPYMGGLIIIAVLTTVDSNAIWLFYLFTALVTGKFGYEVLKEKILKLFI